MGKCDELAKSYFGQNDVYADVFNYLLFGGRHVIRAEDLQPDETEEPPGRLRDLMKSISMKYKDLSLKLYLGLEEQTYADLTMPLRVMDMDCRRYNKQLRMIRRRYKKDKTKLNAGVEFVSRLKKEERLFPVITAVVYLSDKEWDGPKCLGDMMIDLPDDIKACFQDYKLLLITPQNFDPHNAGKLETDFWLLMQAIRYSGKRDKFDILVHENEAFQKMDLEAANLFQEVTHTVIQFEKTINTYEEKEEGGKVDMCKAFDDNRLLGVMEGHASGVDEGISIGKILMLSELGYEKAEISERLSISITTIEDVLSGKKTMS